MAEDVSKVPSPALAQSNVPTLDGTTEQSPPAVAQDASAPFSKPSTAGQDGDGDTAMTSPTRTTNVAAIPTPDASPSAPAAQPPSGPVPLDSPLRTTPIHPSLPSVKVPEAAHLGAPNTNPVTLQPFTEAELAKHGYEKLRAQILSSANPNVTGALSDKEKEEISRMRDETAAALKHKMEEKDAKIRDIDREMEEKEKIREVERKVFRKKLAGGKDV